MKITRRAGLGVAAMGLMLSGTVALGAAPAFASVEPIPLQEGDVSVQVAGARCVIEELASNGYDGCSPTAEDGNIYDAELTDAVRSYQEDAEIAETGDIDAATWEQIAEDVNYAKKGDKRHDLVKGIQTMVNDRTGSGHPDVTVDGKYGAKTVDAVKYFQRHIDGLDDDGIVGHDTLEILFASE